MVNPWAVPLQKPHPRVWIPGVISTETIIWAAQHGYPYIALNTPIDRTKRIWEIYDNAAAELGFTPGPDYHGMLKQIHVAETEEKAIENARQFTWMQGEFTGLAHPVWSTPSGYGSPENRRAFVEFATGRSKNPRYRPALEKQLEELMIIAGTPKTVIAKLRILLQETRPGILAFWGNDGRVSHQDAKTCIRLLGQEGVSSGARYGEGIRPKEPVRDKPAGQHRIHERSWAAGTGRGGRVEPGRESL